MKRKVFQAFLITILTGSMALDAFTFGNTYMPGYEYYQKTLSDSYYNMMKDNVDAELYSAFVNNKTELNKLSEIERIVLTDKIGEQINYSFSQVSFSLDENENVKSDYDKKEKQKLEKSLVKLTTKYLPEDQKLQDEVKEKALEVADDMNEKVLADLTEQVELKNKEIKSLSSAISSTEKSISDTSTQLASENSDMSNDEMDQIEDLNMQLEKLSDKKESIETTKDDLSNFTSFAYTSTVTNYTNSTSDMESAYDSLATKSDNLYDKIDEEIRIFESENGKIPVSVKKAYDVFKEQNDNTLNCLQTNCNVFKNTSMKNADPNIVYLQENNDIEELSASIADNVLLNGTYYVETDNENDDDDGNEESVISEPYSLSDEEYEELKKSVEDLQQEMDSFEEKYGNALNDVADAVNAVTTVFDTMADGGIYDSYTKELCQLSDALCSEMQEFGGVKKNEDIQAFIDEVTGEITDYQDYADDSLNSIQSSVDNAVADITPIMDTANYNTYQNYIAEQVDTAATSLASLKTSIETESAERKTMDEKLSKSIGQINETLMGIIGTTAINNIADGTVTGAIGNSSIAGIGDGTLSGAIVALNNAISQKNYVKDSNNGQNITFSYSKGAMGYNDYPYLAAWNGYEMRAVNKNQFATANHSHSEFNVYNNSFAGGNNRIGDLSGGQQIYLDIRFTEHFSHVPAVVATVNHNYTDILHVSVCNISSTGVRVQVKNIGTVTAPNVYVCWMAFDYLAF